MGASLAVSSAAPSVPTLPAISPASPASQLVRVLPPLEGLFPQGGLQKGTVVTTGGKAPGAGSLALALIAAVTQDGGWAAVVGWPSIGLVAAAEMGVSLERLALVPDPGGRWLSVVAALVDGVEVLLVLPPARVREPDARRLAARARERGCVLVVGPGSLLWPEGADVRLSVETAIWEGLAAGHGHLQGRMVEVAAAGRRAAARERRLRLWMPHPEGRLALVGAAAGLPAVPTQPTVPAGTAVPAVPAVPASPVALGRRTSGA
ncbi:MAG: hypothetical protein ACRDYC_02605 [Acidimicrobiales bacterium]